MTPELRAALADELDPTREWSGEAIVDRLAPIIDAAIADARVTEHYHTRAVVERDVLLAAADEVDAKWKEVTFGCDGVYDEGYMDALDWAEQQLRARANEGTDVPGT